MKQYTFENFIIQCCKTPEPELRKFLRRILRKNGFSIIEDNYTSPRGKLYNGVHNMLAMRGTPKVCLVAHTDVCRDHSGHTKEVKPVIKEIETLLGTKRIIQDETCSIQVGGDDRLGVAINTWIALNTGYDLGLLFTTDEEIGLVSAYEAKFPELKDFDLLCQVDRGNHSNQLVSSVCGVPICSRETARTLLSVAESIELPRYEVNGLPTDVLVISENGMCKDAVNMTCGYHESFGSSPNEFIDIEEARDTMAYVSNIIKFFDLKEFFMEDADKKEPDINLERVSA